MRNLCKIWMDLEEIARIKHQSDYVKFHLRFLFNKLPNIFFIAKHTKQDR